MGEFYPQLTVGRTQPATITATRTVTTTGTLSETTTVTTTSVSIAGGGSVATTTVTVTLTRDSTMDLQATQLLYYGGSPVTLFGTINPPPTSTQGVVMMTRNPQGVVVDVGQAQVSSSTGSYSYVIGAGGSTNWQQGEYSVTASTGSKAATTVFYFTPSQTVNSAALTLQVLAPQLASPGTQIDVGVLATLRSGAPDDVASWSTLAVLFPDGSFHNVCASGATAAGCTGALTRVQLGFYQMIFPVPSPAQQGTYFIEAAGADSSGNSSRAVGEFSVA